MSWYVVTNCWMDAVRSHTAVKYFDGEEEIKYSCVGKNITRACLVSNDDGRTLDEVVIDLADIESNYPSVRTRSYTNDGGALKVFVTVKSNKSNNSSLKVANVCHEIVGDCVVLKQFVEEKLKHARTGSYFLGT